MVDSETFVDLSRPTIAADERCASGGRGRGDERVVHRAATDAKLDQSRYERSVAVGVQRNVWVGEASTKKVSDYVCRRSVGWG